jgi:hypothetical protein
MWNIPAVATALLMIYPVFSQFAYSPIKFLLISLRTNIIFSLQQVVAAVTRCVSLTFELLNNSGYEEFVES